MLSYLGARVSQTLLRILITVKWEPKYHPAKYSFEYSAGRIFASGIFGWNNVFTYKAKNKALQS